MDRNDQRDRLVAEAFNEGWEGFAAKAAKAARRRVAVRRGFAGAGVAAVAFAGVFLGGGRTDLPVGGEKIERSAKAAYEVISDEQLMEALGDRAVLILPQEGAEKVRIVVLR